MALLEIKNLKKSFDDNVVLEDISLNVCKGESMELLIIIIFCMLLIYTGKTQIAQRIHTIIPRDCKRMNFVLVKLVIFRRFYCIIKSHLRTCITYGIAKTRNDISRTR